MRAAGSFDGSHHEPGVRPGFVETGWWQQCRACCGQQHDVRTTTQAASARDVPLFCWAFIDPSTRPQFLRSCFFSQLLAISVLRVSPPANNTPKRQMYSKGLAALTAIKVVLTGCRKFVNKKNADILRVVWSGVGWEGDLYSDGFAVGCGLELDRVQVIV